MKFVKDPTQIFEHGNLYHMTSRGRLQDLYSPSNKTALQVDWAVRPSYKRTEQ